eukprot:CCRYP_016343-RA/>CCRYP_016343-RA protein AED:0.34 eAED:0.52 QI:164/0/0.5/1/0/0/2/0/59
MCVFLRNSSDPPIRQLLVYLFNDDDTKPDQKFSVYWLWHCLNSVANKVVGPYVEKTPRS